MCYYTSPDYDGILTKYGTVVFPQDPGINMIDGGLSFTVVAPIQILQITMSGQVRSGQVRSLQNCYLEQSVVGAAASMVLGPSVVALEAILEIKGVTGNYSGL